MGDILANELLKLRTWNPAPLRAKTAPPDDDSECGDRCAPLVLPPRFTFFDRHIDEKMTLKRVVILPTICQELGQIADDALLDISEREIELPVIQLHRDCFSPLHHRSTPTEPMVDADSVAKFYQWYTSHFCKSMSAMLLYPYMPRWEWLTHWGPTSAIAGEHLEATALKENFTLRIRLDRSRNSEQLTLAKDSLEVLTKEDAQALLNCAERFPFLASWEIFALSERSETVIKEMALLPTLFKHEMCLSTGYGPKRFSPPLTMDAVSPPWSIPTDNSRQASLRSSVNAPPRATSSKNRGVITVPSGKTQTASTRDGTSVADFVQHVSRDNSTSINVYSNTPV